MMFITVQDARLGVALSVQMVRLGGDVHRKGGGVVSVASYG